MTGCDPGSESDDIDMKPARHSKAMSELGYDSGSRTLRIHFRGGGVYDYLDVPVDVFESLQTSLHPWTEWQAHIKASYAARLVTPR